MLLGYLRRAVPLDRLEADTAEEAARNRAFAALVRDIRDFAGGELGLSDTKNYTRFVELDRDYLALVVSASAPDSFTPHEWRFPVVGSVPYKGFFRAENARREAEKLRARGLDVWVREVDAFSTLGWFRDPLYSYMRDYPVHRLADLIIHELLHATVFLKNRTQFNEELAEVVGSEGAVRYVLSRHGEDSPAYRLMRTEKEDGAAFVSRVRELSAELETLYASDMPRAEKLARKETVLAAFKARFEAEYDAYFAGDSYRGFSTLPVNNAFLALYRLYYGDTATLVDLYRESGSDLRAFIGAAKRLRGKQDPYEEFAALLRRADQPSGGNTDG